MGKLTISNKNSLQFLPVEVSTVSPAARAPEDEKTRVLTGSFITSEALFAGERELVIEHAGDAYKLRLTNQGKLILTK
ncbi:MAG: hemin uptake protein HemP [Pseudomonadota bacterium]